MCSQAAYYYYSGTKKSEASISEEQIKAEAVLQVTADSEQEKEEATYGRGLQLCAQQPRCWKDDDRLSCAAVRRFPTVTTQATATTICSWIHIITRTTNMRQRLVGCDEIKATIQTCPE